MKRIALMMACTTVSAVATAGLLGPSNFDECILANMKGVGSDMAARAVAASCAKQFPAKKATEKTAPDDTDAPADVVGNLTGRLGPTGIGHGLSGSLYNGNRDWTITQTTVAVTAKSDKSAREYNINVTITPLTEISDLFVEADITALKQGHEWRVVRARGYKTK